MCCTVPMYATSIKKPMYLYRELPVCHIYIHTYTVRNEPFIYIILFFPQQT